MATENALAVTVNEAASADEENTAEATEQVAKLTPEESAAKDRSDYSNKVQKRINSEVGKRKQAERAQHSAELEAAELRGAAEARKETEPVIENAPTPPGGRETFGTDDDWLSAHKTYDAHQIREGLRKEFKEGQEAQAEESKAERKREDEATEENRRKVSFVESVEEARKNHEDYDEVVRSDSLVMSSELVDLIQASDNSGEVAYHLASNPAESERISSLQPLDIAREVGKIEARLAEPTKKKTTTAPDPLNPVVSGTEIVGKHPDDMTMAEYEKWRYGS